MKVIIVGAGIAGLTLAAACQQSGFEVKVYDKTKNLGNIGGGLMLWPHSIRYLEWMGLFDALKSFRVPVKGCRIVDAQGQTIFSEDYDTLYSLLGGEVLPIDRSLLQQTLANQLIGNVLTLGKECIEIKNEPNKAYVKFADGTEDSADLVVGADGIRSTIRQLINKEAQLQYTDHCWWGGIIEQKDVPNLSPNEVFVAVGLGKMCIVWPTHKNRFMWYLPVKMPESNLAIGNEGLLQLQEICAGWNEDVQKIISAPASAQRFHLPIYTLPPQQNWSSSRITLIGDAAHALGPILGQGANQAIEDVFVLVNCLKNQTTMAEALNRYESLRHIKSERLFELENQSTATMINDNEETLAIFLAQIPHLNLETIYQDLIPLVNENACLALAEALKMNVSKETSAVDLNWTNEPALNNAT